MSVCLKMDLAASHLAKIEQAGLLRTSSFIGGEWINSAESVFPVVDPSTQETIAEVTDHGGPETRAAIESARKAFPVWRALTCKERHNHLMRWFDKISEHTAELSALISLENGKSLKEAAGEVAYGNSYVKWFAEEAKRIEGKVLADSFPDKTALVFKEPVGVVGAITPWNFPNAMITRKVAPALAAGCTVVIKPAEATPLSALALAALAQEAGIPDGVINVVVGQSAAEIGQELATHESVKKLSFTGSTRVGKLLMRQCADTVKKLSLELGGNAPFIIFDDADVDRAIDALILSKFRNSGQVCVAANRIFVQRGIYEMFLTKLIERVNQLRVGYGLENAEIGPLINDTALEKVARLVETAVRDGATVAYGGEVSIPYPHNFQPTVLRDVTPQMEVVTAEVFGPVVPLVAFDEEAEALSLANATPYGLAAYFFTSNASRQWRFTRGLEFGMVGVNEGAISDELTPFGGVKESGLGREGGTSAIDEFLEEKYALFAS